MPIEPELKRLLAPLFAQFATGDGDTRGKLAGYVIALGHVSPEALEAAVRVYLCGEVDGHDGVFLPTSAQLARVVRAEQAKLDNMSGRPRLIVDNSKFDRTPNPKMVEGWARLSQSLAQSADQQAHETRRDFVHRMARDGRVQLIEKGDGQPI